MIRIVNIFLSISCAKLVYGNKHIVVNDPTHGSVVPSTTAAGLPFPVAAGGRCYAGTEYMIRSVEDLKNSIGELECIFAAGVLPNNVPLGYSYGIVLTAANTSYWSFAAENAYQGDYVVKTQCNKREYNIGWLNVGGFDVGTALWYIGDFPFKDRLSTGEYPMGDKSGLIMDFRADIKSLCGIEGSENPIKYKDFSPFKNSLPPINTFVDIARVVGRAPDGGVITLNKAYATPLAPGQGAATVLFYATTTYDPNMMDASWGIGAGTLITVPPGPNGERVIKYTRKGIDGPISRLNPLSFFADLSGVAVKAHDPNSQNNPYVMGNRGELAEFGKMPALLQHANPFFSPWFNAYKYWAEQ